MPASEVEAQEKRNSDLRDQLDVEASVALYYMLVLLTRNEPVEHCGQQWSWTRVCWPGDVWSRGTTVLQQLDWLVLLLNLMNWSFAGDIQSMDGTL